jgi:hypothetical protein
MRFLLVSIFCLLLITNLFRAPHSINCSTSLSLSLSLLSFSQPDAYFLVDMFDQNINKLNKHDLYNIYIYIYILEP